MANRNYRILSHSLLSSVLVLVVLILLNVFFARSVWRLDFTEEGLYTLSPASEKILESIPDPVSIRVFWGNVPSSYDPSQRYIRALLEEMQTVAGDKLRVRWVDMEAEEGEAEAQKLNLMQFEWTMNDAKGQSKQRGYMSLVMESGEQEAKVMDHLATIQFVLEKEIVADIYRRSREEPPIVGIAVAEKAMRGPQAPSRFRWLQDGIAKQRKGAARPYLTLQDPIAPNVKVLAVLAPERLDEKERFHFDQFVMRGGRAIVLLDNVNWNNVNGMAHMREPGSSGLEEWFAEQGITIESGLVGDWAAEVQGTYVFPERNGGLTRNYPYWPAAAAQTGQLDPDHPITKFLPYLRFYWPQAISIDAVQQADSGRTVTVLAKTTRYGERKPEILNVGSRDGILQPEEGELGEIPLAVLIEGPMDSWFKKRPIPGAKPPEGVPPALMPEDGVGAPEDRDGDDGEEGAEEAVPGEPAEGPAHLVRGENCRILLVPDAEFVTAEASVRRLASVNGNTGPAFLLNALDWMTGSEELLALRGKEPMARSIEPVKESAQDMIKWANITVMPLLVLFAGIVMFITRRVRQA